MRNLDGDKSGLAVSAQSHAVGVHRGADAVFHGQGIGIQNGDRAGAGRRFTIHATVGGDQFFTSVVVHDIQQTQTDFSGVFHFSGGGVEHVDLAGVGVSTKQFLAIGAQRDVHEEVAGVFTLVAFCIASGETLFDSACGRVDDSNFVLATVAHEQALGVGIVGSASRPQAYVIDVMQDAAFGTVHNPYAATFR